MNKIGLILYGLIYCFVVLQLLFVSEWRMFVDFLSLTVVIMPAIGIWFTMSGISVRERLSVSLKVCWLSGGLMFTYSLITMFGHINIDLQGMAAGFSIALLPIIYCFVISLFFAPIVLIPKLSQDARFSENPPR
ncbi:hypothetical protein [Photobacterium nomapromontoriensis]|uniref:hypothetical protein n=1 Tax=Photobacterium nomapromontoriensis TaxID=2910237 RepID=UPI003D126401